MEYAPLIVRVLLIYFAAVVSPGPNFAVVSRLSLARSRLDGLSATLGIAISSLIFAVLTLVGLAVLIEQVTWLRWGVRSAGGLYLVYLGVSAWRHRPEPDEAEPASVRFSSAHRGSLPTGLLVGLSNPKTLAFFSGLYAVAVPLDAPLWVKGAIVGGGFAIELGWYASVALLLSSARARAAYHRSRLWIERAFGSLLIAIGLHYLLQGMTAGLA